MGRPVRTVALIDDSTGEIKSSSTIYISSPQREPPYVKIYLDGIKMLCDLPTYCWPLLMWLLPRFPYANSGQLLEVGNATRKLAADDLGMSVSRVNHGISDLVKAGVMLRDNRGLFQFNPHLFARGEWRDIKNLRSSVQEGA